MDVNSSSHGQYGRSLKKGEIPKAIINEKHFVVLYDQEKRYFKVQSGITWKDIMREIKGKYGKMKLILQIWKDNGLIKAKRLISDCKHEKKWC